MTENFNENFKCIVIIPAFNEEDSIRDVVSNIMKVHPKMDYLIINDGSTDNTEKVCRENGFQFITLPINLGIGGAVQSGYRYAMQNDYDIVIQMDGDGQHDPQYLDRIIAPIVEKKANAVIGSRFIENEGFQSSSSRRFGIRILSDLIFICTGKRIKDVTSGYRAVDKTLIKIYTNNYSRDYPEPEAIVTALVHGMKIQEIPVAMRERMTGKSSINLKKSVYYMIKVSLAVVIGRISLGFRKGNKK